jgi:hypothetical protein
MPHAAVDAHTLKICAWQVRHRHISKHERQLTSQLLIFLRRGQSQHMLQCCVQQTVFRPIRGELIKLCEKPIRPKQVLAQMGRHHQLATQGKNIVLPSGVVALNAALDDQFDCPQELRYEDFQQWHATGQQLGLIGLHMPEALQTAEHVDQQLPGLDGAATDGLADPGQHLNLESVGRTQDADKTGHLNGEHALAL